MVTAELTNTEVVDKFLSRIGVSFTAESAGWRNTDNDRQSEWKCVFRLFGSKQWTVRFHMGSAHTEPPTAYDVLNCVVQDNFAVEEGFEDLFDDEDPETPKLQAAATRQYKKFKNFFYGVSDLIMEAMSHIPDLNCGYSEGETPARAALLGEEE
jgi:hypothetical protein